MPDEVSLETLRFIDLGDGRTRLEAQSLCDSIDVRDAWLRSGMEVGVREGYAKLDLRIQFAPQDERWHIAFVGKNLTNNLTTGSAFRLPFPITTVTRSIIFVEPPRNLAIEAGVKF